jgi:tetratricopeptide (TPR) repeat protein
VNLAEAYALAGRCEDARAIVEQGLSVTRQRGERGWHAQAVRLLGDLMSQAGVPGPAHDHYRQALELADELGMRPLVAHCHLGLGKLYRRTGDHAKAHEHLTTATTMYREMGMNFWLAQAEAEAGSAP